MELKSLKSSFLKYCETKKFEKNKNQVEIIEILSTFYQKKKLFNFNFKKNEKKCFYLFGNIGVGKTMVLDFFFNKLDKRKLRLHFNEFMINFHDYRHENKNKENSILSYVKKLKKKYDLIYLDEFQVTNIVDAMILGKLFDTLFKENLKIILSTNIPVDDLYKDGLQREQFLPFISIIQKNSIHKELKIHDDYRKQTLNKLQQAFYPLNEKTFFKINQLFRKLTKNKKKQSIKITTKGRSLILRSYYDGIAKFDFKELCESKLGSEDYINLSKHCKLIVIENIPTFDDNNSNEQLRFIVLIDILYEKKISLIISLKNDLKNIGSSKLHSFTFKRTISRIYELTSPKFLK